MMLEKMSTVPRSCGRPTTRSPGVGTPRFMYQPLRPSANSDAASKPLTRLSFTVPVMMMSRSVKSLRAMVVSRSSISAYMDCTVSSSGSMIDG